MVVSKLTHNGLLDKISLISQDDKILKAINSDGAESHNLATCTQEIDYEELNVKPVST